MGQSAFLQAVAMTTVLMVILGQAVAGVTKKKPLGFGRDYWLAEYKAQKTSDETVLLLKKYFESESSVISSHEYRQFLIEYTLLGANAHTIKKPVL